MLDLRMPPSRVCERVAGRDRSGAVSGSAAADVEGLGCIDGPGDPARIWFSPGVHAFLASSASANDESNGHHGDQVFQAGEVAGISGVEPSAVHVGCGRDEQVHDPAPGLTAGINHRSSEPAIADRYRAVDR
jgi:hypothetical protein